MKLEPSLLVNSLLLLLALGSTVLLLLTDQEPTTAELEARARNLLPNFSRDQFRSLSIRGPRESFLVEVEDRAPAGERRYLLRAAAVHAADSEAVEGLLRSLELAGFVRKLEANSDDRLALGLDAPVGQITLKFEASEVTLRIGKEARTPAETSYVEVVVDRDQVQTYLVRTELLRELLVESTALRKKHLSPYALSELSKIRWQTGTTHNEVRRAEGPDFLDAQGKRAERASVERLGLELARAESKRFLSLKSARQALEADPAALAVEITPTQGRSVLAFRVGGTCPGDPALEVLVRTQPSPSGECVAPGLRQIFRETAAALKDQTPFALRTDEVESLRIDRSGKSLELIRSENGFRMLAPAQGEVELDAGNARLDALVQARGELIEGPNFAALGLVPPTGHARLRSTVIERVPRYEETIETGRVQPDGRLPIRRLRDGVTLLLGREASSAYGVDSLLLRSRRLLDFGPSELSSLTITANGERQRLGRTDDGFVLHEPKGHQHDGALVLDLVQALGTLTADRWVSEAAQPVHGLSKPTAELELELKKPGKDPQRVLLTIGQSAPGGAFGALDTNPGVFVLPRSLVTQATTPLLSRSAFEVDTEQIAEILVQAQGATVSLRRAGDSFVAATRALSPEAIARLVQALSNLRPEAALHAGEARLEEGFAEPRLLIRYTSLVQGQKPVIVRIGSSHIRRSNRYFHARVESVDATYLVPEVTVREIVDQVVD